MHFCLVCNMNKIGRVFVFCILLVVAATGAAELKSKSEARIKSDQAKKSKETTTKATPSHHVSAHASISNGMGMASIAGVDSRYGRLSSMSGAKFSQPMDSSMIKTDSKGNFIFKSVDGKMPMPITITKKGDGVSGTIKIMPGAVSVSSSANSGSASASAGPQIPDYNPWSSLFMKPMMNDLFFPDPFPAFPSIANSAYHTRISEPAYHRIQEPSFSRIPEPTYSRMPEPSFPRIWQPSFPRMSDPWMGKDMFKHSLPEHSMMAPGWYYPPLNYNPFINFW